MTQSSSSSSTPRPVENEKGITAEEYEQIIATQSAEQIIIEVSTGVKLACKAWGPSDSDVRVMAVHGWMDNSNSFDLLAPFLAHHHIRVLCIDLLGHGRSPYIPLWCSYSFADHLATIMDVAHTIGWSRFAILGHSMGGALASVLASTLPESIISFASIDILGPYTRDLRARETIANSLRERNKIVHRKSQFYSSIDEAVEKYKRRNPLISDRAAKLLLKRGTVSVVQPGGKTGLIFRHDPRLVAPSPYSFRESDVIEMLGAIQAPTFLVIASTSAARVKIEEPGLETPFKRRLCALKNLQKYMKIEGSHHVHLDNPQAFANQLANFFIDAHNKSESDNPDCAVSSHPPPPPLVLKAKL
eukprot:TRINITY_DN2455_c0_g1_i4.p1 TRINITY_DN2455_c0_g1~~TRINITY_DN2455_c0_g1_i4.p1  ORF type:complete len:359 (+),score=107.32 TRINITY_DN2455_c0_g1_i4:81-1157(+)